VDLFRPSLGIDYVFGIDMPCISERSQSLNLLEALTNLRAKTVGKHGPFLHRCFSDLVSAMKHADDTGFYCYRAIESLRHHCAAVHDLATADKSTQWAKFREVAGCTEEVLRDIKVSADPLRHGQPAEATSEQRTKLFSATWQVVDAYLAGV
jgi:hypothetical protein